MKFGDRFLDDIIYEDLNNSRDEEVRKRRGLLMSANISALTHRIEEMEGQLYEYETLTS
jgi:hypothetical protein